MRREGLSCILSGAARLASGASASEWRRAGAAAALSSLASTSSSSPSSSNSLQRKKPSRRRFDALLIDATGTLITPSEPVTHVYRSYAAKHGIEPIPPTPAILAGFRRAYNAPWPPPSWNNNNFSSSSSSSSSSLSPRFAGGGRPFWRSVVAHSLGFPDPRALPRECFDDIYDHFSSKEAWRFAARGVRRSLKKIRRGGVRIAVVSNFDSRLRGILEQMRVLPLVDACVVSGDHGGAEKPGPVLFDEAFRALRALGPVDVLEEEEEEEEDGAKTSSLRSSPRLLERARTLVVGDDRRNDVMGGRAAGFLSWHWGTEVRSLNSLAARVLGETGDDDDEEDEDGRARAGESDDDDDDDEDDAA